MDTVNTSLLKSMSTFLFTEARRIACKCLRKLFLRDDLVNEFTDHGMLTCSDQVKILTFDLVHHSIHLRKAHNACNNVASDHERRYAVSKSPVDHEISCIGNYCGMKACDITHQIIESVTGNTSCAVKIDSIKILHDICMIRNFKIRNNRLTKFLNLYVLAVVFTDRYRRIDDVRDHHHIFQKLFLNLFLSLRKFLNTSSGCSNLFFNLFCLFSFSLAHKSTDLFGDLVSLSTESLNLLLDLSVFFIKFENLVNQLQFAVLELIADILLYNLRILSHKLNV